MGGIRLYWRIIPVHKRRKCLFKESCSNNVFRIAKEKGFFPACRALNIRLHQCRPGYYIITLPDETSCLYLADGTTLMEGEIAGYLIQDPVHEILIVND